MHGFVVHQDPLRGYCCAVVRAELYRQVRTFVWVCCFAPQLRHGQVADRRALEGLHALRGWHRAAKPSFGPDTPALVPLSVVVSGASGDSRPPRPCWPRASGDIRLLLYGTGTLIFREKVAQAVKGLRSLCSCRLLLSSSKRRCLVQRQIGSSPVWDPRVYSPARSLKHS